MTSLERLYYWERVVRYNFWEDTDIVEVPLYFPERSRLRQVKRSE